MTFVRILTTSIRVFGVLVALKKVDSTNRFLTTESISGDLQCNLLSSLFCPKKVDSTNHFLETVKREVIKDPRTSEFENPCHSGIW